MNEIDSLVEQIQAEYMAKHAQYVKEYCESHKTCKECSFFNGTCRLNDIPSNWTLHTSF